MELDFQESPEDQSMAETENGPCDRRWERAQSAGRSQDKRIMPDAVGSTESLASAGPASSCSQTVGLRQGKPLIM